jgi:DNA-binding PadR family transcriptional regulator
MIYAIECLRMPRDAFSGHLDLLLLAALEARSMHGYALIEYVRETSGGQFDYAEGTIYPALRRLEDDGLVRSGWNDSSGRRRRVYELSAKGAKALAGGRSDWERFARGVEAVLGHG